MYFIGVDIGGTGIQAGVVNQDGKILFRKECSTDIKNGFEKIMNDINTLVRELLYENKIDIDMDLILYDKFTAKGGYNSAEKLLKTHKKVDAIFAGNDVIALGILDYASTHEYNIPNDLGVIGFDNIFYSDLPQIQLTTMHQPKYELGEYAVKILLDKILNGENKVKKRITLDPKLIIRKTYLS